MKNLLKKLQLDEEISNINQDLDTANKNLELKNTELAEVNKHIKDLQKLEPEKIKEELENAKTKMKELEDAHKIELNNIKIDNAINTSLLKSGAINNKAVAPFINKDIIKFDDKGNIVGLDDQVKHLMKSEETSFLFKKQEKPNIKGLDIQDKENAKPGDSLGKPINNNYLNQKTFKLGGIPSYEIFEQQFNNN